MKCAICMFVHMGEAADAIMILNGQSVCEDHTWTLGGGEHSRAINLALRMAETANGE